MIQPEVELEAYTQLAFHADGRKVPMAISKGTADIGHEYFNIRLGTWPNEIMVYLDPSQMSELAGKITEALVTDSVEVSK